VNLMKTTDFAKHLTDFFTNYLPIVRNLSSNTISSYRDAFRLFLKFCQEVQGIKAEKLCFHMIKKELLTDFLNWLESDRYCSIATRNQRLMAIHAFFKYVLIQEPAYMDICQQILQVPSKKCHRSTIVHLTAEQTKELLHAPDSLKATGRRDRTLLSVLYDTGARVQELCDLKVCDVRLDHPEMITLTGKGRKTRNVPILGNTVILLRQYMVENNLLRNGHQAFPLFFNQQRKKLTRGGVTYILQKYEAAIKQNHSSFPKRLTPHILRHSKAMHLYQAGVNLVYIRDILGHVDISTTDIYARLDMESKRKILEKAYPKITSDELPEWNQDNQLLDFLNSL
jgi:Site-specific recombinase XerD